MPPKDLQRTSVSNRAVETRTRNDPNRGGDDNEPFSRTRCAGLDLSSPPYVKKRGTFCLPEAAAELFLRARRWHFFERGGGRSLKSSTVLHAIMKHHMHWGYRYGYGPAWLNMGGAYDGWTFLVCVDPGSPEFGNINAHHDSLGPEGCSSVFTEDCENSEMFLRFLEADAKRFLIGWEM